MHEELVVEVLHSVTKPRAGAKALAGGSTTATRPWSLS